MSPALFVQAIHMSTGEIHSIEPTMLNIFLLGRTLNDYKILVKKNGIITEFKPQAMDVNVIQNEFNEQFLNDPVITAPTLREFFMAMGKAAHYLEHLEEPFMAMGFIQKCLNDAHPDWRKLFEHITYHND